MYIISVCMSDECVYIFYRQYDPAANDDDDASERLQYSSYKFFGRVSQNSKEINRSVCTAMKIIFYAFSPFFMAFIFMHDNCLKLSCRYSSSFSPLFIVIRIFSFFPSRVAKVEDLFFYIFYAIRTIFLELSPASHGYYYFVSLHK